MNTDLCILYWPNNLKYHLCYKTSPRLNELPNEVIDIDINDNLNFKRSKRAYFIVSDNNNNIISPIFASKASCLNYAKTNNIMLSHMTKKRLVVASVTNSLLKC